MPSLEDEDDVIAQPSIPEPQGLTQRFTQSSSNVSGLPKEVRNLLAGGIAGMAAKSVVAPMDRIKILYQVSAKEFHMSDVPRMGRRIVKDEGITALWKGNTATMIRVFPYAGVQFMVFDRCKGYFLEKHERRRRHGYHPEGRAWGLSASESLIAGSLAGAISVACTYPLDMTRAQLAVMKKHRNQHNMNFVQVLGQNYAERGVRGLFRGITPTLLGILPYSGSAFAMNEQGKRYLRHLQNHEPTTIQKMECGAVSGLIAQTLTYPLEVTRRRMQTMTVLSKGDVALDMTSGKKCGSEISMIGTMRALYSEQGVRGFFKGVSMNWVKGPVSFAISFTAFDVVQGMMETELEKIQRHERMRH
eukprot:CAMPEP_0194051994 /NCGR_PEP_ID=MMETSP0009_2-20130614/43454_1 /TAXON_ID=210454 /ORGANISM="Grammatophora oceanica, Strain CCMP 410" /LENGTH=359 /DNA_ID=CAMNT_0038699359 /DNA_START=8 /DNA_END=1087 /DNA_ORIENTATION=-